MGRALLPRVRGMRLVGAGIASRLAPPVHRGPEGLAQGVGIVRRRKGPDVSLLPVPEQSSLHAKARAALALAVVPWVLRPRVSGALLGHCPRRTRSLAPGTCDLARHARRSPRALRPWLVVPVTGATHR